MVIIYTPAVDNVCALDRKKENVRGTQRGVLRGFFQLTYRRGAVNTSDCAFI